MARGVRARATERTTRALLLRRVDYGETDLVVTFLTEAMGKVGAIVRGGRRSQKRAGGALEAMQTTEVMLEDRGGELVTLREARIVRARVALLGKLDALEAAGTALRWARHACPPRMPEPEVFAELGDLLDALDAGPEGARIEPALARFGVRLLEHVGWGLELEQCAICGKPRPPERSAIVVAAQGGVVCRACAGPAAAGVKPTPGRVVHAVAALSSTRAAPSEALFEELPADVVKTALAWVRGALAAHAGFEE